MSTNDPKLIIVHHDGVSRAGPSFDIVNEYHKHKDFPVSRRGFYVGYHLWIERDGTVRHPRDFDEEGAHTVGQNLSSIGIGLAGNFDTELPTREQVAALGIMLSDLRKQFGLPYAAIVPHRKFAQKTCYGSKLPDGWAAVVCLIHDLTQPGV